MTDVPKGHVPGSTDADHMPPPETAPAQIPPEDTVPHSGPGHEPHPDAIHVLPPAEKAAARIPPEGTVPYPGAKPAAGRSAAAAVLLGVSALLLLGAGYLFWQSRTVAGGTAQRLDGLDQQVASVSQQVGTIEPRLKSVEARPLPSPPPDLRPMQQKLAELDQRLAAAEQRLPKLDALDQRLTALDQREAAFEQKPPPPVPLDPPGRAEVAAMAGRIDQLVARQNQIGEAAQADAARVQDQIARQDQRIAAAARNSTQIESLTSGAARMIALQGATTALASGRPLGDLPGAPPALAQFASRPPPTEASLRLSFADAAAAARAAGLPPKTDGAFLDRIWARAQSSVTVRQGDRVLVGDAISGVLAHAQEQVDAGDLAGTLHTLDQLAGPAAAAMQPWRQQAQSLLDARAALVTMAHS